MRLTSKPLSLASGALLAGFLLAGVPPAARAAEADTLRSRADALRRDGDLPGAIAGYERAIAAGGPKAELLSEIGNCREGLRENRAAAAAYQAALALSPDDRGTRRDLDDLRRRRGLALRAVLGGTEPGTSRQAFDADIRYGGIDRLDLAAGYGWTDQVYYTSNKGFATAYWFYRGDSYAKADFTLRRYSYPTDPVVQRPNPDSNAYDFVPRGELEVAHWLARTFRAGLQYQLFTPNFYYDTASRATNHKLTAEAYWITPFEPLRLTAFAAVLRDPDPGATRILGRNGATATSVAYRNTSLFGGAVALDGGRWNAEVRFIPNRDLDNSYDWSLLSTVGFSAGESLGFRLQHVYDTYSSVSNYAGRGANVLMGQALYQVGFGLAVGAGLKYVDAPTRQGATLLASLEYRTGLW